MRPLFENAATVQHHHEIGLGKGQQAVREQYNRALVLIWLQRAKELAQAEAGIRAAREVGAEDTPKAALQLKIAQDGVQRAQKLSADGEHERARAALQEAELDAELAVLLAKQEKMEASAAQAKSRADSLNQAKSESQMKEQEP